MRQYIPVITLALLSALALAVVSGGLLPSDNAVLAEHIDAPENAQPVFATGVDTPSIAENTPPGVNIGAPISATDADGDVLTYTLGDNDDEASFDIDESTGQLITKVDLDYEPNGTTYMVTVTADDGREGTRDQTVSIMVTDVAEEPAAPAAPVVTTGAVSGSETTTLEINWFAPANTGSPITDYDYRYKLTTETSWTVVENGTSAGTTATISPLEADTAYQVSVRATSDEGDGPWSLAATGSTNKEGNAAPEFTGTSTTRSVAENTPPDLRVGAAVTAMDDNSTTLNYSLAGEDADSFDIDESTGQIMTKAELNHETKGTSTVFVVVDDDGDGGSDVITVTITVTDVSERPSRPAAPTVERVEDDPDTDDNDPDTHADDESATRLKVSWTAPATDGPPIDDYDIEYRKGTTGAFSDDNCGGTTGGNNCRDIEGTETTITGLEASSSYEVRVTANSNDEQDSQPSLPGTGSTMPANIAPRFSTDILTLNVDENTPEGRNIGSAIRATDSGDTLTYSLVDPNPGSDGDDEDSFDIDEGILQLKTKAALDYEAKSSYAVTVAATDQKGASDTIEVTITVDNVHEPPLAPSTPTVSVNANSPTNTLDVTWTAPDNEGRPAITEYEVEYRANDRGSWVDVTGVGASTSAMITGLDAFTSYTVRVRAINDEGESPYVTSSELTNNVANALPTFTDGADTARNVEENTTRGLDVGTPVAATDTNSDDLTYSLGGEHADLFDIDDETGQIKAKEPLNLEAECSSDDTNHETTCTYSVDVKVVDGNGGSDTISVTINVTEDGGGAEGTEAPEVPSAPTVKAAVSTEDEPNLDPTSMLEVSWDPPQNDGPSITTYEVQYKISGVSGENFVTVNIEFDGANDGTKTSVTITGMDDNTSYDVQVMATNAEGSSVFSSVGSGNTRFSNARPDFARDVYILRVDENTGSRQSIGRPVEATDDDGHRLTYTLEGVHKDHFTIVSGSGNIRTSGSLDYEARRSYSLTVRATDILNASATASVTVEVKNENEEPTTPGSPTVSGVQGSTSDVRVTWEVPANTGQPPIIDYDVQYREVGGGFKPWRHDSTDTSTIITDLSASKRYEVQVKAWNMEDESEWSLSGRGSPDADPANNAPVYTGGVRNFTVEENTGAGVNIGEPVTASDQDRGDTLTYSLEGADSASFEIVSVSGQIQTKTGVDYNYEAPKNSYSVTVRAADDRGGSDTVAVTIAVTDSGVDEPPEAPDAPTVAATSGLDTSLDVSWVAPENPGPAITDYDYQYKETSSSSWTVVDNTTITATSVTIPSLNPVTSYDVQVRARNADGPSGWSDTGPGSTSEPVANRAPVFSEGASTTRTVSETAQASSRIGAPVAATDADAGATLAYSLEGADAASFGINPANGQLLTLAGVTLDRSTYTVDVVASDGSATSRITVTITVTPNRAPVFSEGATATRSVREDAASDTAIGSPVTATDADPGARLTYRVEGTDAGSFTINTANGQLLTSAALDADTKATYTVDVVASDGSLEARITVTITVTATNMAPVFSEGASTTRTVSENAQASSPVGAPVTATDADNDTLVYSLDGTDASSFDITSSGGQLLVGAGTVLDASTKSTYSVTVVANDGSLDARITVTITVTPTNRAPVFSEGGTATRSVREDAASGTAIGSPVTATDADPGARLTYRVEGTDAGSFTINTANGQLLTSAALDADTKATYTVDVVASDGSLEARITVTITVTALPTSFGCATRGAVSDASNTGLVSDCEALLDARDVLVGLGGPLNWSASTPIAQWDGVTVDETSMRVTTLDLRRSRLKGVISSDLSRVTALRELYLQDNHLTGPIPSELGSMTELRQLRLRSNGLSGPLPAALGSLTNLTHLLLSDNDLSGSIPSQIGDMSSLYWLDVGQNNISGTLPAELGNLSQLGRLYVYDNDLTGSIPSTLGNLTGLTHIVAQENDLSGSIPVQLGNMSALVWMGLYDNDLSGAIPTQLSRLSNLQRLYLSNNDLTGTIPRELGQLSALTDLWLDDNGLSGTIPSELDQLTNLVRWRMRGNDFTGCVPAGLAAVRSTDLDQLGLPVCSGS